MTDVDKKSAFSALLDIYGSLLTDRQRQTLDLYCNEDESLFEIAEKLSMTRQGVRCAILAAEAELLRLDDALGLSPIFASLAEIAEDGDTPIKIKQAIKQIIPAGDR